MKKSKMIKALLMLLAVTVVVLTGCGSDIGNAGFLEQECQNR